METKKIRIGNDIRLLVDLRQYIGSNNNYLKEREVYQPSDSSFENIDSNPFVNKQYEVYYPNNGYGENTNQSIEYTADSTPVSIRSVEAILVNTSLLLDDLKNMQKFHNDMKEYDDKLFKNSRYIARFPIEPCMRAFEPTPYDVCMAGYPTWRAYPRWRFPVYCGFGLDPRWGGIYRTMHPNPHKPCKPHTFEKDYKYFAEVMATAHQNVVEVSFPAQHLLHPGIYKLIIVAKLYAPGFNNTNTKTVTIDMPNVFELVSTTEEGWDTGIKINVSNLIDKLPEGDVYDAIDDVYVDNGAFEDNFIRLNRTDGDTVDVDLSSISDWYEGN